MIKNHVTLGLLLLGACGEVTPPGYQGVVEHESRVLAFEVPGRVLEVFVAEGAGVDAGARVARLDDSLERLALVARQNEAQVARDQLALLRGGARPEDLRALRARIDAARASESLLASNARRSRQLHAAGAVTAAALDDAEAQSARASAERLALTQNLRAMERGARAEEIEAAVHRVGAAEAAVHMQEARIARFALATERPGEILDVHVEPGEVVAAGTPVVTVADTARPRADVFVPQGQLAGVAVGTPVRARVDGVDHEVPGQVEVVGRRTEFTPRYLFSPEERANLVVRVRVRLQDPRRQLHAGVPVFVRIERGGRD